MSAYRFCRSDDVPLIVEAYERCNVGPGAVPWQLTIDHMKRLSREMDLWTSSCMVALAGTDPIGVLIAAKREPTANLILHAAVHPDHRRQGHARHMMTSLSQKMAILEPTRMLVEVPADALAAHGFLAACGFARAESFTDYFHTGEMEAAGPVLELAGTVSPAEILGSAELGDASELNRCWQRSPRTITNLRQGARGVGIATDRGFEAYLLYRSHSDADDPLPFTARPSSPPDLRSGPAPCEILAIGGLRPVPALLRPLLALAARDCGRPLSLPRVHPTEPLAERLHEHGFQEAGKTLRYESDAARS